MKAVKRAPMRICAFCRTQLPKREMLRLALSSDGQLSIDETGKKPGRGLYICHSPECEAKAARGANLEKISGVKVGDDIKSHFDKTESRKDNNGN